MAFVICGRMFKTQKAVLDHVRSEIYTDRYQDNESLSDEHFRFMLGLLSYHQLAEQKIGCGVKRIWIAKNSEFPTRGFFLERLDGTTTDFSFVQCVKRKSARAEFISACRNAIYIYVMEFKNAAFAEGNLICPYRGTVITKEDCHIDHAPPNTFAEIVNGFIQEHGIDIESVAIQHGDNCQGDKLADLEFEGRWIEFHNARASLRAISKAANLSDVRLEAAR